MKKSVLNIIQRLIRKVSKGFDLKKLLSSWEKEGCLEQKKQVLDKIPRTCIRCSSSSIEYWDETDEEIIFQCKDCKRFIAIPYKSDKQKLFYYTSGIGVSWSVFFRTEATCRHASWSAKNNL